MVGSTLHLACKSLGSSEIRFNWLKDGHPIDLALSDGIIQDVIDRNEKQERTCFLNIEKVTALDGGNRPSLYIMFTNVHLKRNLTSCVFIIHANNSFLFANVRCLFM